MSKCVLVSGNFLVKSNYVRCVLGRISHRSLLFCQLVSLYQIFFIFSLVTHTYIVNVTCHSFHVKKIVFIEIFAHIVMAHLDKMIFVVRPKVKVVSKCQRVQRVLPASLFSSFMANLL